MPYQTKREQIMIPRARKRFGFSHSFGTTFLGYSFYGQYNEFAGVYQYRNSAGQRKHVKMRMYWPSNPRTVPQQAWRAVFADGAIAWASLTSEEKLIYNKRAKRLKMTGYHLFQREWLQSH